MNTATVVTTNSTDGAIIRTTTFRTDHTDYSWLALGLLAAALIAVGLRKLFWNRNSN